MARYDREYKLYALIELRANAHNVKGTADKLGIPSNTLREWSKDPDLMNDTTKLGAERVVEVKLAQKLESIIEDLFTKTEELLEDGNLKMPETVNALEKFIKIQGLFKAEAPDVEEEKPSAEKVQDTLEQLANSYKPEEMN